VNIQIKVPSKKMHWKVPLKIHIISLEVFKLSWFYFSSFMFLHFDTNQGKGKV